MNLQTYLPTEKLRPFIKSYLFIECENDRENRVLPDTSIVLAFRYQGRISVQENGLTTTLPASVVSGIRKQSRLIQYRKGTANLLVVFREGVAAAFFKEPIHELAGLSVPLDCLTGFPHTREIEERLATAPDNAHRIALVEQMLLSRLTHSSTDRLVLHAIEKIRSGRGLLRMKELIQDLPLSQDPFEKRFRQLTGTSPKQFSSIVRLKSAIDQHRRVGSLTQLALETGYYDQSHFIKDFKGFTGLSPLNFFHTAVYW
jgi:AraC-like DNA-binding protein